MTATSASYTTVSVSSFDEAVAYYRDVLTMDLVDEVEVSGPGLSALYSLDRARVRRAVMQLPGGSRLHIEHHLNHTGRPIAATLTQYDFGFIHLDFAAHGLHETYARFSETGVPLHCEIQVNERRQNHCLSFGAPDGVRMECHEWYGPNEVGHGSWVPDVDADRPFYAFVHTALSVGDMGSMLRLYRDLLGLPIIGESHLEHSRFDQMDGHVGGIAKNVLVRGERGSEVQFIWHHAGSRHRKGKPVGRTQQQCDLGIVNIGFETDDLEGLRDRLTEERVLLVSDIVEDGAGSAAFSFRDPDGNLLLATQAA